MRFSSLFVTTALAGALMTTAASAETVRLYTWRVQELPLWQYISENDVLGVIDVEAVLIQSDNYDSKLRVDLQSEGIDLFQGRAGAVDGCEVGDVGHRSDTWNLHAILPPADNVAPSRGWLAPPMHVCATST